jgi:valyl-tRNA synthetase
VLLRLLAPFLPYVTEEVWSWWAAAESGSIHRSPWPSAEELAAAPSSIDIWPAAREVLGEIRKAKTEAGLSLRAPVASVRVTAAESRLVALRAAEDDLREAGVIGSIGWDPAADPEETRIDVKVELA